MGLKKILKGIKFSIRNSDYDKKYYDYEDKEPEIVRYNDEPDSDSDSGNDSGSDDD